jgi:hypothetical protein
MQRKKSDEQQPMKIQSTALKTRKTVEMDHVRRRLSSSRNNVSNMRLDGAMGTPLQVQVGTPIWHKEFSDDQVSQQPLTFWFTGINYAVGHSFQYVTEV